MPDRIRPENPFSSRFTRPGALPYLTTDGTGPIQSGGGQNGGGSTATIARPVAIEELAAQAAAHRRSCIVGPHGTGKSTLLAHLLPHLEQRTGRSVATTTLQIGSDAAALWSTLGSLQPHDTMVVDGYEQLSATARARLIITSRLRHTRLLVTAHRRPWLFHIIARTDTSRRTARQLAAMLLAPHPEHDEAILRRFDEHWQAAGGNVRQLWATLYEQFEERLSS